ncbi:MAG: type II toxin-antitoxin system PemK/MazF family toxin [Pyrinomonadaceae bacterium]|nr:type II toxin-antitoxin system PemK/MazF family toxin [Pyrinomonadaceae bacterium]
MKRGKIVLTPFPFTDLTANKVRPAVVVSDSARMGVDVVLAFISSVYNSSNLSATDELLETTDAEFALSGLKKNSVFKMDKLATVDSAIILGEMGETSPTLQAKLDAKLKIALALK